MTADEGTDVFLGHGRTGQVIRHYDWANNPLGPIHDWSHSLRALVGVILDSAFPFARRLRWAKRERCCRVESAHWDTRTKC